MTKIQTAPLGLVLELSLKCTNQSGGCERSPEVTPPCRRARPGVILLPAPGLPHSSQPTHTALAAGVPPQLQPPGSPLGWALPWDLGGGNSTRPSEEQALINLSGECSNHWFGYKSGIRGAGMRETTMGLVVWFGFGFEFYKRQRRIKARTRAQRTSLACTGRRGGMPREGGAYCPHKAKCQSCRRRQDFRDIPDLVNCLRMASCWECRLFQITLPHMQHPSPQLFNRGN